MAEDSDLERTEPASPRRIEQAREQGQVPRSRELSTFAVLMAAGMGLFALASGLMQSMSGLLRKGLDVDRTVAFDPTLLISRLHDLSTEVLLAFLPFLAIVFIAALVAPMALSGWLFTMKAVEPDFSKLNPLKGLARIFSVTGLVELAKASAKTLLIGGVAAAVIWHQLDAMFALPTQSFEAGLSHLGQLVAFTFFAVVGAMVLLVALDVPYQLWDYGRKLRMSREELRQEAKEQEGDPQLKARIRSMQREQARRRMMSEVPKADVIVTNPTRYAVALKYEGQSMRAPKVVAKGAHLVAARIREIGTEHRVPILEAPPLARALYKHADLGAEIPDKLYTAVAEVLAYIYQLRQFQRSGGMAPRPPGTLPVPPELDPEANV